MSVFEVGTTISESIGGHASAGGDSGAGNRFFFTDDNYCELGLQRGTAYNVRIRLNKATSGYFKLTMIGHRGYATNSMANSPFCYIVEALPQNMGDRTALNSTYQNISTKSFEEGIEAQHLMGIEAGDLHPTVSCFQYTEYTEITLRVMNQSNTSASSDNRSNRIDSTATDHSAALTKHYAGNEDTTVAGQAGELGGDAIFFTAYIEGYSYNTPVYGRIGYGEDEAIFTSYNRIFGGRGMMGGGYGTESVNIIEYIAIGVKGNSVDFGDLTQVRRNLSSSTNGSRALWNGGRPASGTLDTIDYVTISTLENAKDFGELTAARHYLTATEDGNRAVVGPGNGQHEVIDYYTVGIQGNAIDFAEPFQARENAAGNSNGSRACFSGGYTPTAQSDTIDFLTIGILASAKDFGNLSAVRQTSATSDGSRGVTCGGIGPPAVDIIDYWNIGTLGNVQDYGNLSQARYDTSASSDGSRGVSAGGYSSTGSANVNTIDYFDIAIPTATASDFGDLTAARQNLAMSSGD